jgi:HlyD family secretion protein
MIMVDSISRRIRRVVFMPWKSLVAGAALLAAVLVGMGFFWPFHHRMETLRLPGIVEIQEVRLGSKCGGRVAEVCVTEGEVVKPGTVLVRFDVPELEAQRDQCQARIRALEAELAKAKNGPRVQEIRRAENELATAQADLQWSRQEFARVERLQRSGGSDRAEYDSARASRDRALGRVGAAQAMLDLLRAGTRPEEIAEIEGRVGEMRGKLRELEANLREATVIAPERAVVDVLAVRKGDLVTPNQSIVRVLRADDLWVKVYVPEIQLGKVILGQEVEVTIDAYPRKRFTGKVIKIDAESEFTPRNVQSVDERRYQVFGIKVRVSQSEGIFKSGMAAEVTFNFNS